MKKLIIIALVLVMAGGAFAASAKATASSGSLVVFNAAAAGDDWVTIMKQGIRCANNKDLIIDVSMVSALMTNTVVRTKGGAKDTQTATAGVVVKVLLDAGTPDERPISPGEVTFAKRTQTLTATLQGIITEECFDPNGHMIGDLEDPDSACLTEEEIGLLLDTTSANAFNFICDDVSSGDHTITVKVQGQTSDTIEIPGDADGDGVIDNKETITVSNATVIVGPASMSVEEVRFVKGDDATILIGN